MKALILDGSAEPGGVIESARQALVAEFAELNWQVEQFTLRDMEIAHCIGCFGCWMKTPGECVIDDPGRDIARATVNSNVTVLLTPVTFGGYSSQLKKAWDRIISIISPAFVQLGGETRHKKRYETYPRLLAIGVEDQPDEEAERTFTTLASRNAINLHSPAFAAGVMQSDWDADEVRKTTRALLEPLGVRQ